MTSLCYLLILAVSTPEPFSVMPLWDYHQRQLHANLEGNNYYEAKRALAQLKAFDPQTYKVKGFDITAALIASREENWASAYELNRSSGHQDASAALEAAQSLGKLGRFEDALDLLFNQNHRFQGRQKYEVYHLAAHCHLAVGNRDQALKFYQKLLKRQTPTLFRTTAYNMLVELYYKNNQFKKARQLAQRVQKNFPASDAALFTMYLQEAYEGPDYLEKPGNVERFASVCYRNRDFERSDIYYNQLLTLSKGKTAAKARYHLALTHTKRGDAETALAAFEEAAPYLADTAYEGPAQFQLARTLYLNQRDLETIEQVSRYWHQSRDPKWRFEGARLWILAVRRLGDHDAFAQLEQTLRKDRPPNWLWRYYHKNGMIWAMQETRYQDAAQHLDAYSRRGGLKKEARTEAQLWRGLIAWALGEKETAVEQWVSVADRDPNHYFGLIARRLLDEGASDTLLWEHTAAHAGDLQAQSIKDLRRLYHLAPNPQWRARVGEALQARFYASKAGLRFQQATLDSSKAKAMADIGRFDWAANILAKNSRAFLGYHYHKARLFQQAGDMKSSIRHAEILVNGYPRWMPYELMPREVQELHFPLGFSEIVHQRARQRGVDPHLLLAIIREESRFDQYAKSWASARGLMQFIPSTAREMAARTEGIGTFSLPKLYQPEVAVNLGATYVDHLMNTFNGASIHTVAAYNAGEGATTRWRDFSRESRSLAFVWDVTYSETKRYCQKVMRAYHHYNRLYGQPEEVLGVPDLRKPAYL